MKSKKPSSQFNARDMKQARDLAKAVDEYNEARRLVIRAREHMEGVNERLEYLRNQGDRDWAKIVKGHQRDARIELSKRQDKLDNRRNVMEQTYKRIREG